MAKSRRQRVIERAGNSCEYCQMPQQCTSLPHELDHIRSRCKGGKRGKATGALHVAGAGALHLGGQGLACSLRLVKRRGKKVREVEKVVCP